MDITSILKERGVVLWTLSIIWLKDCAIYSNRIGFYSDLSTSTCRPNSILPVSAVPVLNTEQSLF